MTKEDFVALGISEDLAEKAAEAVTKEYKDYVPRTRLNEEIQKKKNAEESYNTTKSELEKLKESAGDNAALKEKITSLQADLKDRDAKYAKEIADMKMTNAIQAAVSSSAQDAELVAGLFDRSKLILTDEGKVTGLDEQLNALKETKPFLFKDGETYPNVRDGGEPGGTGSTKARDQFANWLNDINGGN